VLSFLNVIQQLEVIKMKFQAKYIDKITKIDGDTFQFEYGKKLTVKIMRRTQEWNVSLDIEINGRTFQYNCDVSDRDRELFAIVSRLEFSDRDNKEMKRDNDTRVILKALGVI